MTTLLFILPFLILYTILVVYAERKIAAFMQDRLGPMEVGYYGILQTVADLLKLLQKEDILASKVDRFIFRFAPLLIFISVFLGFVVVPLGPAWPGAPISSGFFFLLGIVALDVIGIVAAGWASNNKYSMLGTLRSAVQMFSYEIPLGLSALCACVFCGTLNLQEISLQQGIVGDQETIGGIVSWNIVRMPTLFLAWIIFFITSLAESNRAPFDLPEAESELVAGFQVEYSGFRWAIIMLAEYSMMLLLSLAAVILFWGSWNTPLPNLGPLTLAKWTTGSLGSASAYFWGIFWLVSKTFVMIALQIWVRWTFPRVRIDQLISLCWKYLTPFSLFLLIITSLLKLTFL